MPPKAKFSREEIITVAFDIVKEEGTQGLSARALGTKLGSSARPIFTLFSNMEEVQKAVIEEAKKLYTEYIEKGLSEDNAFRGVGIHYILFALEEPKLFQLLFMAEKKEIPRLSGILPIIDDNYEKILLSIKKDFGLEGEEAKIIYHHLWIYTHGIATLCATKMCYFTRDEVEVMTGEVCKSLLINMKVGKK